MTSTDSPRVRRQQRTRRAILDAARQIINEKGPVALSMRALARHIDYSPAGLYEYFDGKDAIIKAVCGEGQDLLAGRMASVDPALPADEPFTFTGVQFKSYWSGTTRADYTPIASYVNDSSVPSGKVTVLRACADGDAPAGL